MNTVELVGYALDNALGILGQVVADLTQEQADWTPPGLANPIGATYWHVVSSVDDLVHRWINGGDPLYLKEGWQERVLTVAPPEPGRGGDVLAYMRAIRVDVPTLHLYAELVAGAAQRWLASLTPEDLGREMETVFGPLTVGALLEKFGVWHISAHCGEISALKGCLGARGYPF